MAKALVHAQQGTSLLTKRGMSGKHGRSYSRITYMYLTSTYLILGTRGKDYVHTECFSVLMHTRLASLERDRPVRYLPRCACCWLLRPTRHSTNDSAYSMYWCAYCEVRLSVSYHTSNCLDWAPQGGVHYSTSNTLQYASYTGLRNTSEHLRACPCPALQLFLPSVQSFSVAGELLVP